MIDPKKYGAETSSDVATFLVGAFVGGTLDALFNVVGFAEPIVFAPLCGAGAMGVKKFIFDVPRHRRDAAKQLLMEKLRYEADLARRAGDTKKAEELEDTANRLKFE